MCHRDIGVRPEITAVKRLGHPRPSKTQPLLVHVSRSADAQDIISNAKRLRQSHDDHVKSGVYINPNLTKAEARAAYEIRCRIRSSKQQAQNHGSTSPVPAGTPMGPTTTSPSLNPIAPVFNPTC